MDDPYWQGWITAANVLSDLYAAGVVCISQVLMTLAFGNKMDGQEATVSGKLMIKGFNDAVSHVGSVVVGGQTIKNEWPMIGGTAIGFQHKDIGGWWSPKNAAPGDVLLLTKPIGNQMIVNFNRYRKTNDPRWQVLLSSQKISESQMDDLYDLGLTYMARMNKNAAIGLLKFGATSSTDITGFGI